MAGSTAAEGARCSVTCFLAVHENRRGRHSRNYAGAVPLRASSGRRMRAILGAARSSNAPNALLDALKPSEGPYKGAQARSFHGTLCAQG